MQARGGRPRESEIAPIGVRGRRSRNLALAQGCMPPDLLPSPTFPGGGVAARAEIAPQHALEVRVLGIERLRQS
jgi:hypothetical protein